MTTTAPKIPATSDVVIVGGGIAGITAAWFLNKAGVAVTVCEKGSIAGEQSSRNWGWIRQQGRDQSELPIVMESMRLWQEIADELDEDIGYRREGSLYLCENDAEMANHDRFMSFAPTYGLDTARLNRKQLEALMPDCPSRWQSALYTPDDGRAEPSLAVQAMARTLTGRGVCIIENCAVQQILTQNQRVSGVLSEHGEIRAGSILCAGGAWSTFLLKSCGIRLPQLTVKASVARTAPAPLLFNGNASGSQVSFRRRLDGGYSVASSDYLEIFPSLAHLQFLPDFVPLMKT
ncbi:MAG TPA: FAD-dependent oxidoreductase, partial [Gammaproteobacteria bacterium]|nr:FAD-dependent oxidoreductase [Gammaproteobacteria bacterium]